MAEPTEPAQNVQLGKIPGVSGTLPLMYRDFCLPNLKSRIANLKSLGVDVFFHSCGNSRELMAQFIEAGVAVYQSIQSIPEMWIGDLKRDFGDSY